MSFAITDLKDKTLELNVNTWNWRPTLEIIKLYGIIDPKRIDMMSNNGTSIRVDAEEAKEIGRKIQEEFLSRMTPDSRVLQDLTITNEPDDGTFYREASELWKNYSATYAWLKMFSEFCLASDGFEVN